jgi:predicted aldo/keto reductase-like oxidoreductase
MGSYTASGDGDEMEGNLENIRLANKHDMGVFIISPYDKGGRLYAPSHQLRQLTLPEMEPMDYGSYWLWYHNEHKKGDTVARADTIVCGAARPSDLDQPVLAALRMLNEPAAAKADFEAVHSRITERRESVFGKDWADTWQVGLPNYSQSPGKGSQIGYGLVVQCHSNVWYVGLCQGTICHTDW